MRPLTDAPPFRLRARLALILLLVVQAAAPAAAKPSFRISFLVDYRSAGTLASPTVAVQGEGETAFVWWGECPDPGLCLSHYSPGQPPSPAVLLDVGGTLPDSAPRAAVGAAGELVLVWSEPAAGSTRRIAGRLYDFFGVPLGSKFIVAAGAGEVFAHPDVAVTADGRLVVAFERRSFGGEPDAGIEILGRLLAADGTPSGAPFRIDTATSAEVAMPRVAAGPGEVVVVWESRLPEAGEGIGMCRVTDLSAPECEVPDAFAAPRSATVHRREPTIAASTQGTFLVAWTDVGLAAGAEPEVRVQVLHEGAALLADPPAYPASSAPAADGADDVFLLVWTTHPSGEPRQVSARRFDALGEPLEEAYLLSSANVLGTGAPLTPDAGLYGVRGLDTGILAGWRHRDPQDQLSIVGARASSRTNPPTSCTETEETLCLGAGDQFQVRAFWSRSQPGPPIGGAGLGVEITPDTGYFWFFRETNVEVLVKVLDGCSVNGHHWVFAAGLTDLGVDLEVYDTRTQESEIYERDEGQPFQPIQDTAAFPCS